MTSTELLDASRCYQCIPSSLQASVIINLLQQWPQGEPCFHPQVADWVMRTTSYGGVPTEDTQEALCRFMLALDVAGLTGEMIAVNCVVPDDLICAETPLINVPMLIDPWIDQGFAPFVAADLNVNGLIGDGDKSLDTGVLPVDNFTDNTDCGLTIYLYGPSVENENLAELGTDDAPGDGTDCLMFAAELLGDLYFDCYDNHVGAGRNILAVASSTGYFCSVRHGAGEDHVYNAYSTFPHAAISSIATASVGNLPSIHAIAAWSHWNSSLGQAVLYTKNRLSFVAIHHGLTEAQSSDFFDAVQQLRQDLHGGFV